MFYLNNIFELLILIPIQVTIKFYITYDRIYALPLERLSCLFLITGQINPSTSSEYLSCSFIPVIYKLNVFYAGIQGFYNFFKPIRYYCLSALSFYRKRDWFFAPILL